MRNARHMPRCFLGVLLLSLLLGPLSCGDHEETNEIRLFLDRVEGLDTVTLEERRDRVESLANFRFTTESVESARAQCVEMQQALIESEELMARAQAAARRLEREGGDATPEELQALDGAGDAMQRSQSLRRPCQQALEALRQRVAARQST